VPDSAQRSFDFIFLDGSPSFVGFLPFEIGRHGCGRAERSMRLTRSSWIHPQDGEQKNQKKEELETFGPPFLMVRKPLARRRSCMAATVGQSQTVGSAKRGKPPDEFRG
jgi:hypothetical protein